MSVSKITPTPFISLYGENLLDNGYEIHPVGYGEKAIYAKGWQNNPLNYSDLDHLITQGNGNMGISILTKQTPAVDIDILDDTISTHMASWVIQNIINSKAHPQVLSRVGQSPKVLLLFKTSNPFKKVTSKTFIDDSGVKHRVEILGEGQQFVAYNLPKKARKDYQWLGSNNPVTVPAHQLPELTINDAYLIVKEFEAAAIAAGWSSAQGNNTLTNNTETDDVREFRDLEFFHINNKLNTNDTTELSDILQNVRSAINFLTKQGAIFEDRDLWVKVFHALSCAKGTQLEDDFHSFFKLITTDLEKDGDCWDSCSPTNTNWLVIIKTAQNLGWIHPLIKPRIQLNKGFFSPVGQLSITPNNWLIKGYIEHDTTALIYGEPGSGKSFFAIDLALSVATGNSWNGAKSIPGGVFYISGEGQRGFGKRTRAWSMKNATGLEHAPLYFGEHAVTLMNEDAAEEVIGQIEAIRTQYNITPKMVVIDTLHNCYSGNENDSNDMGAFLKCLNKIRYKYKCNILIVHHSGKSSPGTARGSSSLKAGVDAEYFVRKKNDKITIANTKMKDAEIVNDQYFMCEEIKLCDDRGVLSTDEDGKQLSSLVLTPCSQSESKKTPVGKNQLHIYNTLKELSIDDFNEPHESTPCSLKCLKDACCTEHGISKKAFDATVKVLAESEVILHAGGNVYLA